MINLYIFFYIFFYVLFMQINEIHENKTHAKIKSVNFMFEFHSFSSRLKCLTLNSPNKEKLRKRKRI